MPDIESTISLNATNYLTPLREINTELETYAKRVAEAEKAAQAFAGHKAPQLPVSNVSKELREIAEAQKKLVEDIKTQYTSLTQHFTTISNKLQEQLDKTSKLTSLDRARTQAAKDQSTATQKVTDDLKKQNTLMEQAARKQMETFKQRAIALGANAIPQGTDPAKAARAQQAIAIAQQSAINEYNKKVQTTYGNVAQSYLAKGQRPEDAIQAVQSAAAYRGLGVPEQIQRENLNAATQLGDLRETQRKVEWRITNEIKKQLELLKETDKVETKKAATKKEPRKADTTDLDAVRSRLSGELSLGGAHFLERFRYQKIRDIAPNTAEKATLANEEAIAEQAELHLRSTRRNIFARYQAEAEKAKLSVAKSYLSSGMTADEATAASKRAIGIMTQQPAIDPTERKAQIQQEVALAKENLTVYSTLVKFLAMRDQLEKSISTEVDKQKRIAKTTLAQVEKAAVSDRYRERQEKLIAGGQLKWLQDTFQKTHGREITGFGLVDVTRMGHQLLETYAKTPIDFKEKYKDLAQGTEIGNFQRIIAEMQKGNAELIGQYPELAKAASGYNKAIKYGEVESARFVAHWDNFFRLVLARGVTLVFYSISNAIKQAANDAVELWKSIAEVQTISGKSKMSVDQWALSIKNLSNAYHITQQDIVEALYQIQSNQVATGQGAVIFAGTAAGLAKATKSSLTESVNALSSVVNSYNISITNAEIISAQLFKTIELGRVRLGDMANTIGRITSMSSLLGVSLEEVQGLIDFITIGGVKFERSGTYIVNIMNSLLKPSDKMKAFFSSINVESGEAAIAVYGLANVMRMLTEYTHGQSGELADLIKNLRAITGFASVTRNVDKYEELVGKTKTAMESYLEAQKYIYTGPGERFLEIVTKGKNVFIEAAQSILQALLKVDDLLKKEHGNIAHFAARSGLGIQGLSDLPAYIPALGTFVGTSLLGRTMAALPNDPEISKAFKSAGNRWGVILAGAVFLNTRMNLYAERMFKDMKEDYSDFIDGMKIEMEKRYHEEQDLVTETLKTHTLAYMKEKTALKTHLAEQAEEWKNYYSTITRPLEITMQSAKDLQSIYEDLIERKENLFVGFAYNPLDEFVRRVAVSRDILSRFDQYGSENRIDIAQRFMQRSQSTLTELDKKIQEIITSGGKAKDAMYLEPLMLLRDDLLGMMQTILKQYADEVGAPSNIVDLYEGLFGAKTLEQKWDDYFKEFKDLAEKVSKALDDEASSSQAIKDLLYLQLTERQKQIYTSYIEPQKQFQDYLKAAEKLNLASEKEFEERKKIEKQREQIGAGKATEYMRGDVFSNLYTSAKVLASYNPEQFGDLAKQGEEINDLFASFKGIIPVERQQEFDATLKAFIDNFGMGNEKLRAEIERLADTFAILPGQMTKRKAAETILATYEETLGESLQPPVLKAGGGLIGGPKGTDTVPAWLTPGEFVVKRDMAQKHAPLLERLNAGYYAEGGEVDDIFSHLMLFWAMQQQNYMPQRRYMFDTYGAGPHALPMTQQQMYMQQRNMQQTGGLGYFASRAKAQRNRREALRQKYANSDYDIVFSGLGYKLIPKQQPPDYRNYGTDLFNWGMNELATKDVSSPAVIREAANQRIQERESRRQLLIQAYKEAVAERENMGLRHRLLSGHRGRYDDIYGSGTWRDYALGALTGIGLSAPAVPALATFAAPIASSSLLALLAGIPAATLAGGKALMGAIGLGSLKAAGMTTGLVGLQELFSFITNPEYKFGDIWQRLPMEIAISRFMGSGTAALSKKGLSSGAGVIDPNFGITPGMAGGGWVTQPRGRFQSGGMVSGQTINNYSTTANVTMQTAGNEGYDARRLVDNINRELHRGTRRLK